MWNPIFDRVDVVGIAQIRLDGFIERCNAAYAGFLHESPTSIAGRHIATLCSPANRDRVFRNLQSMEAGEIDDARNTKYLVTPVGDKIPARVHWVLIRDANRQPNHIVSFVTEATGAATLAQLRRRNVQLEELLATVLKAQAVTVNMVQNDNSQTAIADNQATATATRNDHNRPPLPQPPIGGIILGVILAAILAALFVIAAK